MHGSSATASEHIAFLSLALALLAAIQQTGALLGRPSAAVNLVRNPNFEQTDAGGWPSDWGRATAFRRSTAQHVVGAFASLEYENYDPSFTQMVTQTVPGVQPGHQYTLSADMMAAGLNNSAFGGGATICATWNAPPFFGDYLGSGPAGHTNWTTQQLTFVYPASRPAMSVAVYVRPLVQGTNRTPTGVAYFGNVSLIHNPPQPIRTELLSPLYRGRIYGTTTHKITVRAHLHFELQPNETGTVSLVATVRRRGGAAAVGPVIAVQRLGPFPFARGVSIDERAIDIVFAEPPANLLAGAYIVTVNCLDAANETLGTPQLHNLTRIGDDTRPSAVSIDNMQRTIVADAGPFFPIGWFFGSGEEMSPGGADFWKFELLSKSVFNTVMPYGESSRTNLDAAAALGMKVVSSLKQAYFGLPGGDGSWPAAITSIAAEVPYLRDRIVAARNHSALLGWYINDELAQSFLPQIKTHYELFVALDPDHPTWQVLCEVGHFSDYLGTFDVIGSDPYPIGRPNRGPWGVRQEINDTVVETDAARPVWELLQAIDWALYNPTMCKSSRVGNASLCRTPNATEVRSMTWQAIANGANGKYKRTLLRFSKTVFIEWADKCEKTF